MGQEAKGRTESVSAPSFASRDDFRKEWPSMGCQYGPTHFRKLSLELYPELVTHYLDTLNDSKFSFEFGYKLGKLL